MGSVGIDVTTTTPLPEAVENAVTTLYRHDCANAGNYGDECPQRWSKFASHEDDQAHLKNSIQRDPIIHRHCFNKDDKKCLYSYSFTHPLTSSLPAHKWTASYVWASRPEIQLVFDANWQMDYLHSLISSPKPERQ
jgi:hypothetical protein